MKGGSNVTITGELRALIQFLQKTLGHHDQLELISELMEKAAANKLPSLTLRALIWMEAMRLQAYWRQVVDTGRTIMGSPPLEPDWFQRNLEQITVLIESVEASE